MRRRIAEQPRVGIDAAQLGVRGKGVARYLVEMLPALAAAANDVELVALMPRGLQLPPGAEAIGACEIRERPAIAWEQFGLPRTARRLGLSLIHTITDRLPAIATPRSVVYLFEDPSRRVALSRQRPGARQRIADGLTTAFYPRTLARASLVLTSSEATRRDVLARGVDSARVVVVYPGISPAFRPGDAGEIAAIRAGLGFPGGYVLHFSSDDPRDNTSVTLGAYAALCSDLPDAPPLVVAGPVSVGLAGQQQEADRLGIRKRVHWPGYVSGDALGRLYRGAAAYVDPSLFEGFGFQVGEALASGVPVVCSNVTSLPEVVGDAGLLVAPDDVAGFSDALRRVLVEAGVADRLALLGPRQVARFDWARTAAETVEAWRDVLR